VTRRKTFDPTSVTIAFWRRDDVRLALARREVGELFQLFLAAHCECTQAQLALLTFHDRSDISNFVRGTRSSRVTDIDVLGRVADGLMMPDEARVMLGLAPAAAPTSTFRADDTVATAPSSGTACVTTGWFLPAAIDRPLRIALCGSRAAGVDNSVVDAAVAAVSRLLINNSCEVDHGPMGVGIEIVTYIADHYRPPTLRAAIGLFGRSNVVRNADLVLVIGGGKGTADEVDLAASMNKKILPFTASGGAAALAYQRMQATVGLRRWLPDDQFAALGACRTADDFADLVNQIISTTRSVACE
jgi:hypothetical protein